MAMTIMFVHGAWVTPQCWANFRSFFSSKGYECLAPAWPYMDRPVKELLSKPDPRLAHQTIKDLVDHFEKEIRKLQEPPILIGHSFGGLIVQLLMDRGLGKAGIAIDAAPPRGVIPSLRAIRSALPVLLAWMGWKRILTMSFENFAATFANSLPEAEMRPTFEKEIVPAPGRIYFQAALGLGNGLSFGNPKRGPLLLVAGDHDWTSTTSMGKAMFKRHSRSPSPTDFISFPGRSHWLIAEKGWEEVAATLHQWIEKRAPASKPSQGRSS